MLNRITISALIKSIILIVSSLVIGGFAVNAWTSWQRLMMTERVATVAEASANLFRAMHNLRVDRSTSSRELSADQPITTDNTAYLRSLRDVEVPALAKGLELLPGIGFPQQDILIPELDRLYRALVAHHDEF
jgi:hypothetical protein